MSRKLTTEEFIERARKVHGNLYDYSKVNYTGNACKITIICKTHGEFLQQPNAHTVSNQGCPECGNIKKGLSKRTKHKQVIAKFISTHANSYNYSKVNYKGDKKKVVITCLTHGDFNQTPHNHIQGQGCPECGLKKKAEGNRLKQDKVIQKFIKTHGNLYSYTKVDYKKTTKKVTITCHKHGDFQQTPGNHINGHGCLICGLKKTKESVTYTQEETIKKFIAIHGNKYDYSKVNYTHSHTHVTITCKIHGDFLQMPVVHFLGCGCSKCSSQTSSGEINLVKFLNKFITTKIRNRKLIKPKEIDILIPEKKVAIEYNGSYFHSEKFAKNPKWHLIEKTKSCKEKGIRLIHISDYENKTVVKKTLAHILGFDTEKYFARKCTVDILSSNTEEVTQFLNTNHLQGAVKGCTAYCLRLNGSMVACMLFSKASSERGNKDCTRWELRRFSSVCRIVGGASRLLKAFTRDNKECGTLISYSDNRWFTGKMYENLGFTLVRVLDPDYKYVKGNKIEPKNKFKRSCLAARDDIDFRPEESERVNANRNGWYRIWDCGKKKWELEIHQ